MNRSHRLVLWRGPATKRLRSVGGEPRIFRDFTFWPAVLPHVVLVDLVSAKVKEFRSAFDDLFAGVRVGIAAFPCACDAVAVMTPVGFVDLQVVGVFEPAARLVPQAVA